MIIKNRLNSIRWRIVLIYFLLVFIAMTITGVFIMSELEAYQMESIRNNFTKIVKENILSLQEYENLENYQAEIQADILAWSESLREEMFVVNDKFIIIASSNLNYIGKSGLDLLDQNILVRGLTGEIAEADGVLSSGIPVKNMVFPLENNGEIIGVVCLRADISSVYETQDQSKMIFLKAMFVALFVTVVLGFFIARSITIPINELTAKAEKMSQGDFSQEVSIKSDDEIGRLAEMFNLLRKKLDFTLSEISNEKSKLETILKYMADGLLAIDMDRRIILANPAAMIMLSITQEDISNKYYDTIMGKYGKNLLFNHIHEKCKNGGAHDTFDYDGMAFSVRYDLFKDENNKDVGIIMLLQDITEQQKLENMQRDFVANVSHELKTPLTTIKSYTETLLDNEFNNIETVKSFLSVVDAEADRMSRLVRELLQLSKLDYNREKWYKKEVNIINVIKSAVTKIEMTAAGKRQNINCIFDVEQRLTTIIDRDRIEQVLLNVISNAIKYSPEGENIEINAFQEDNEVHVVIKDHGIGISEKEISRVFERFYRIDKARSREMGGTGLGLSIAKQIVEEHNGKIKMESQLGKGSKVSIILPSAPTRGQRNIE
ncbi:MAG: ATP-binding protein [Anaerovoracaceae bacterium]|jgi:two-component system sensor histidine kinase VicK